jgi:hypothetical protein
LSGQGYRIHRAAVADLDGAAEWYDAREPGLGLAFVDAVIAGIEAIVAARAPGSATAWSPDGRSGASYSPGSRSSVFYYCEREAVFVVALCRRLSMAGGDSRIHDLRRLSAELDVRFPPLAELAPPSRAADPGALTRAPHTLLRRPRDR